MIYAGSMDLTRLAEVIDPGFMSGYESWPLDELRTKRKEAEQIEAAISYARRIIQGRIDIFEKYLNGELGLKTTETLSVASEAIAEHVTASNSRIMHNDISADYLLPAPSDISKFTGIDLEKIPAEVSDLKLLLPEYIRVEKMLSNYRRQLHLVIDELRTQLVLRYQSGEINVDSILSATEEG